MPLIDSPLVLEASVRHRPKTLGASQLATLAVGWAATGAAAVAARSAWPMVIGALAVLGFVIRAARSLARRDGVVGRLGVTAEGLELDGVSLVRRADIASAYVVPREAARGAVVQIEPRRGVTLDVGVGSIAEARRVLEALGMDTRRRSQTFSAVAPTVRRYGLALLAVLPLLAAHFLFAAAPDQRTAIALVCLVASVFMVAPALVPTHLTVASDGVVMRWSWQRTFVPIADVADVEIGEEPLLFSRMATVRVTRRSGPPATLFAGVLWSSERYERKNAEILARRDAIAERIREAIADRDARAADPIRLPERGNQTASAWIEELRRLAITGGYRAEARPDPAGLWRVVEDPSKGPEARAAAAVALGPSLDDAGRQRLRVAAETTATPELRVALDAAAEADDDALAKAVVALEERTAST